MKRLEVQEINKSKRCSKSSQSKSRIIRTRHYLLTRVVLKVARLIAIVVHNPVDRASSVRQHCRT
jgi:hypothetical protein